MGWTYFHREPSLSVKDCLAHEFRNDNWRIIDAAIVNRGEYYAAIEYVVDGGYYPKGSVHALICLVRHPTRSKYNFGYKDMSEEMGPYVYNCPKRILDLLTPTEHKNALEWRAACRAKQAKAKPKPGQTVEFAEPITFRNDLTLTRFRYVKGSRFTADQPFSGALYRITGWKDRAYSVIPSGWDSVTS